VSEEELLQKGKTGEMFPIKLNRSFRSALNEYHKKRYEACSDSIKKGMRYMKAEIYKINGNYPLYFKESMNRLEYVTDALREGKVKNEAILRHIFSESQASIADAYINSTICSKDVKGKCNDQLLYVSEALKEGSEIAEEDVKGDFEKLQKEIDQIRTRFTSSTDASFTKQLSKSKSKLNDLNLKMSTAFSIHRNDYK
jgi:gas vesicle protein